MRRPLLALLLVSACSPAAVPPPVAPSPAVTVAVPPVVAAEPAPPPVVASASPPGEPPPPPEPATDPCRGSAFDMAALPPCKTHLHGEPDSQTARLAVSLVPEAPRVRSGDEIGASLVFTNQGSEPLPVNVHDGCATVELGAYDARGVRRDQVVSDCGFGSGCGGSVLRLVVEPGGTIVRHLRFKATVTKVTAKTHCQDVDAGGLPPGKYTLRATGHMPHWLEDVEGKKLPSPTVSARIEVTR